MAEIAKRNLVISIRKLIARFAHSDVSNAELFTAINFLVGKLREISDHPSHSKWYLADKEREVQEFEKLYFLPRTRRKKPIDSVAVSSGTKTTDTQPVSATSPSEVRKIGKGRGNNQK